MTSSGPTSSSGGSNSFVEQTVSLLGTTVAYMRLPALVSTVREPEQPPNMGLLMLIVKGFAAVLTTLLWFKQKCVLPP